VDTLSVAGDVVTAGTALAGLVLIYIGTLVAAFGAFEPDERRTVRGRFLGRAWLAFVGLMLALIAAALAVIGKWQSVACAVNVSVWFLLAAFVWATLVGIMTIREIR
jgi:hypothetical protein